MGFTCGFYSVVLLHPGVLCQCPQADPRLSAVEYINSVQTRASINRLYLKLYLTSIYMYFTNIFMHISMTIVKPEKDIVQIKH